LASRRGGLCLATAILGKRTPDIVGLLELSLLVAPNITLVAFVRLDEFATCGHGPLSFGEVCIPTAEPTFNQVSERGFLRKVRLRAMPSAGDKQSYLASRAFVAGAFERREATPRMSATTAKKTITFPAVLRAGWDISSDPAPTWEPGTGLLNL
jgi:hypothetical protein